MRQSLAPTGRVHITLSDPRSGAVVLRRTVPNLVTTAGRTLLANLLTGAARGIAQIELAVGSGMQEGDESVPAPSPADTELRNEARRVDTELTAPRVSDDDPPRSVTAVTAVLEAKLDSESLVLREAGLIMTPLGNGNGDGDGDGDGDEGDGSEGGAKLVPGPSKDGGSQSEKGGMPGPDSGKLVPDAEPAEPEPKILYNRVVFPTITKEPELQMTLTWEVIY